MNKKIESIKNLAYAFEAYLKQKEKVGYLPVRLWIEITGVCNLKCIMCPQSSRKDLGHMSIELFKKIIDEASGFVHDTKLNIGGEPTLHPHFDELIRYAEDNKLQTEMHTNATALSKEKSIRLLDSRLSVISFSLDAFDKKTYEASRVGGKFEATIENIKQFLELKKSRGSGKPYTIIQLMQIPGVSDNKSKVENRVREFYKGSQIDEIKTIQAHNFGGKVKNAETQKNLFDFKKHKPHPCGEIYHAMSIKWSGKVVPCCTDFHDQLVLGDVNENSLLEIWKNKKYRMLRRNLIKGNNHQIPLCADCESTYAKLPFGVPNNMIGMARSLVGRGKFIGKLEKLVRDALLIK